MPDMHFVTSSNIESVGYDPDTMELYVCFLNGGATYVYYGVESWTFDELMQADSKGSYHYREIRGRYDYAKL